MNENLDGTWVSVHAYHDGDLDSLITDAAAPVARGLVAEDAAHAWFFLRYWDGGPHVRLRVRAAAGRDSEVAAALLDRFADHLRRRPSERRYDQAGYAATAARLAGYERLETYERTLRPPDSAALVPYLPEHHAYGHGDSLAAVERHFAESSEIAAGVLEAATPPPLRLGLALSFALVTLAVLYPDPDALVLEYAAATDAFDARLAGAAGRDDPYVAQRDRLREQVEGVWAMVNDEGGQSNGALGWWLRSVRALRTRLAEPGVAAELAVEPPPSPLGWPGKRTAVEGILMRCTHLINNRMGVTVPDEMHVAYLMARTLADLGNRSLR